MAATLQVAGRRAHKLSSSSLDQADPTRSRAGHAGDCCTLHRAMASHSRRRHSRARHRLSAASERRCWLDVEDATCAQYS